MKKGEMKKNEIIKTAEYLFCRYGYESTSIQDILNELHTSKGSFYHHFISKEALLEEICSNRASEHSQYVLNHLSDEKDPLKQLNILLSGMIPFSGEKITFLLMLLPVFNLPEGVQIKNCYGKELRDLYYSSLTDVIEKGNNAGIFSCQNPAFSADIVLLMVNHCWFEICALILSNEKAGVATDPSDLLSFTGLYRTSVERILSAPYGSVDLMLLPDLKTIIEQIHSHWSQL